MKPLHVTLMAVLFLSGCSDVRSPTQATPTPTPQAKTTPTTPVNGANWIADATVL